MTGPQLTGGSAAVRSAPESMAGAAVSELRQYRLVPAASGTFVDLFEAHFIGGQQDVGIHVGAILLDPDDEQSFVWMRGFHDMEQRRKSLESFYYGPVWRRHREVANPMLDDNDDVLLLRPTDPPHPPAQHRIPGADQDVVHLTVIVHDGGAPFENWMAGTVHPQLEHHLGTSVAMWRTEPATNTFEALPVRDDQAVVWSATFADQAAHDRAIDRLESAADWAQSLAPRLKNQSTKIHQQTLHPTPRSRHASPRPGNETL